MEKEVISDERQKLIQGTVRDLVEKMNIEGEIEIASLNNDNKNENDLVCNIKTKDSNYLIGQYGVNLQALQHIARLITRKKINEQINFTLDVNSYRQEKNESVISLAKNIAQRVISEGRAVTMRPMSAYERRLVHMELSKNEKIQAESVGAGEERHIVVKPTGLI